MARTVAVILSGCGVFDGSEIHETVLTFLELENAGATYECFAPDVSTLLPTAKCVDHRTGQPVGPPRNPLEEGARLSRGPIRPLDTLVAEDFDAIVLPGGFGAVTVLSAFADQGAEFDVLPDLERVVIKAYEQGIPIGCMCIAPLVVARILRDRAQDLAVAYCEDVALTQALKVQGATPVVVPPGESVVDRRNKVVSTPAYLQTERISAISLGIRSFAQALLSLNDI